jgi:hypothetical protein
LLCHCTNISFFLFGIVFLLRLVLRMTRRHACLVKKKRNILWICSIGSKLSLLFGYTRIWTFTSIFTSVSFPRRSLFIQWFRMCCSLASFKQTRLYTGCMQLKN